jgi:hypothetical protein
LSGYVPQANPAVVMTLMKFEHVDTYIGLNPPNVYLKPPAGTPADIHEWWASPDQVGSVATMTYRHHQSYQDYLYVDKAAIDQLCALGLISGDLLNNIQSIAAYQMGYYWATLPDVYARVPLLARPAVPVGA